MNFEKVILPVVTSLLVALLVVVVAATNVHPPQIASATTTQFQSALKAADQLIAQGRLEDANRLIDATSKSVSQAERKKADQCGLVIYEHGYFFLGMFQDEFRSGNKLRAVRLMRAHLAGQIADLDAQKVC